ncbi:DUF4136 domain-containing protein [Altericroceibacterium endophyticum]|uniref:DUF4136 domain-containing protein n=1 Tax=Altericroceibacterium endophyticum TaxID=1808508 RepID=A0A6I4T1X6_9SPHN|nr:DUF4136 domain-containing protein [Altericroceibacterium endophyticum]MXO64352.1 hypothetical protein [Altericroceibacterium endophyticum]
MKPLNRFGAPTALAAFAMLISLPLPANAQPIGWGSSQMGPTAGRYRSAWPERRRSPSPSVREGKVSVERFVAADKQDMLGHGKIVVTSLTADTGPMNDKAVYEAALIDQLARLGYDTAVPQAFESRTDTQIAEITVFRDIAIPAEGKRDPISGEAAVSVSNRGTGYGLAVNVDLTKPEKAMLSTRIEVRVRDAKSNDVLWEGRASMLSREGSEQYTENAIASRLADALFSEFPVGPDDSVVE